MTAVNPSTETSPMRMCFSVSIKVSMCSSEGGCLPLSCMHYCQPCSADSGGSCGAADTMPFHSHAPTASVVSQVE